MVDAGHGRILLMSGAALASACSSQADRANPDQVLCAAEALFKARQAGVSAADSDRLRLQAAHFRDMLPKSQIEEASARIDFLADARGARALVAPRRCESLLAAISKKARN
ncbi:hypothetical protein [Sphingosinicella sp. BN140058]|uniref:hypothetical protein n=1 Tax=Sphingosinicella sp. BN140058 TaxID=1892855 RepID=UPI0010100D41|nr:hypothetical protein [Sphingosinicella sp. BN140058]QAY75225.1 hypothetical protein ETR14_00770 [Sphingosinicella sp. BN140058]